jgi:ATP-dependent RNA helicase DHX29
MAPKKSRNKGTTTPQPDSSKGGGAKSTNTRVSRGRAAAAAGAPQVKISSENEVRLRRLLHNTKGGIVSSSSSSSSSSAPAAGAGQKEDLTETQKKQAGRRLRSLYDTLVAEGFSSLQIEQALAALPLVTETKLLSLLNPNP